MDDLETLESVVRLTGEVHRGSSPEAVLALLATELQALTSAHDVAFVDDAPQGDEASTSLTLALTTDAPVARYVVVHRNGSAFAATDRRVAEHVVTAAGAALTALHARELSRVDFVTRVLSRAALRQALDEEVARSRRSHEPLACALFDLDGFKAVNDELGHLAGDGVLREVGAALRATARPYDRVARFGGDEFVVLMPNTGAADAVVVAERLRRRVGERASRVGAGQIACSAGTAVLDSDGAADGLLERADRSLREAKRSGRAQTVAAPDDGTAQAQRTQSGPLTDDLRAVLRGESIVTLFQPICVLGDDDITAYEALSRGPGGLERPDRLLAAARDAGELVAVDDRLRAASFATARAAGLRAPASLFVNIEPETLVALVDDDRLWAREKLPYPSLTEVTERALFASPGRLLRACRALRQRGWGIALDDVGQDPRALALLPLLAPDVIKLDLRLLRERPAEELADLTIAVSAQVEHGGAVLLAEGIEDEAQRATALGLGAQMGQGWMFGRPGELEAGAARGTPVRRVTDFLTMEGITPFGVLASHEPIRTVEESLLAELQVTLERRAIGLGAVGTIATLVPQRLAADGVGTRFDHLGAELGLSVLLSAAELEDGDPMAEEWVTVVLCAELGVAFAARPAPGRSRRWDVSISHSLIAGRRVSEQVLIAAEEAPRRRAGDAGPAAPG